MNEIEAPNDQRAGMSSAGVTINLRKLEELLTPNPLVEIAMLINRLTYGEMIELAEAMWKTHTEGLAITEDNLPALLHRWCKCHLAVAEGGAQERVSA